MEDKIQVAFECPNSQCDQKILLSKPRSRKSVEIKCPKCKQPIRVAFDVTKDPQPVRAWISQPTKNGAAHQPLRQQAAPEQTCYPSAEDAARLRALADGKPWPPESAGNQPAQPRQQAPAPAAPPAQGATQMPAAAPQQRPQQPAPQAAPQQPQQPRQQRPQMHTQFVDDMGHAPAQQIPVPQPPKQQYSGARPQQGMGAGQYKTETSIELPSPGVRPGPQSPAAAPMHPAGAIPMGKSQYSIEIEVYLTHVKWMGLNNVRYRLPGGSTLVGRACTQKRSDIMFDNDEAMSRQSVEIIIDKTAEGYYFMMRVLNAVNPVVHNGRDLRPGQSVYLRFGDTIILGTTKLKFDNK